MEKVLHYNSECIVQMNILVFVKFYLSLHIWAGVNFVIQYVMLSSIHYSGRIDSSCAFLEIPKFQSRKNSDVTEPSPEQMTFEASIDDPTATVSGHPLIKRPFHFTDRVKGPEEDFWGVKSKSCSPALKLSPLMYKRNFPSGRVSTGISMPSMLQLSSPGPAFSTSKTMRAATPAFSVRTMKDMGLCNAIGPFGTPCTVTLLVSNASQRPRAQATTSAFTVLLSVETTNSKVPSPAPAASTLKVTGTPKAAGPYC
uniref:Uncharacterized protein n=1 Tax=Glossina austeni TaxID=7395 RepID=A0A1A9VFQ6_GLOAU